MKLDVFSMKLRDICVLDPILFGDYAFSKVLDSILRGNERDSYIVSKIASSRNLRGECDG